MQIPIISFIIRRVNWEFWLGNIIVVLSTVLGVYLASHAALETGLKFESIRADVAGYNLRRSMKEEILHNFRVVDKLQKMINRGASYHSSSPDFPKLRTFVIEAMKKNPSTLSLPSEIITGTLDFYEAAQDQMDRASRKLIGSDYMMKKIQKERSKVKKNVLSIINKDIKRLKTRIDKAAEPKGFSFLNL